MYICSTKFVFRAKGKCSVFFEGGVLVLNPRNRGDLLFVGNTIIMGNFITAFYFQV